MKRKIILYLVLVLFAVIFLFPFLLMVMGTFIYTPTPYLKEGFWIPDKLLLENYVQVFTNKTTLTWIKNTFIYALVPTFFNVLFDTILGYIFAKKVFKHREKLFWLFIALMMIPPQMSLIPKYLMFSSFGWLNQYRAILVPAIWLIPMMFLMRQYMKTIPNAIIESAEVEGAGDFRKIFQIIIPMSVTPIATVAIFSFLAYWNLFMDILIYMNDAKMYNLSVGLGTLIQKQGNYGLEMTSALINFVPVFLVYLFCQRYFKAGINITGLKA